MADATQTQIFFDHEADRGTRVKWYAGRLAIYGILLVWTVVCLFPIYWTLTTSFKLAPNVMQGHLIPWVDFTPQWKGWESIGLSPRLIEAAFHDFAGLPHRSQIVAERNGVTFVNDSKATNADSAAQALQALPFAVTIVVLAGAIGRAIAPAADGVPFERSK